MANLKIDRGVPVPPVKAGFLAAIRDMRPGDSVLFDDPKDAARFRRAFYPAKKLAVVRKTRDGWRVWMVDK